MLLRIVGSLWILWLQLRLVENSLTPIHRLSSLHLESFWETSHVTLATKLFCAKLPETKALFVTPKGLTSRFDGLLVRGAKGLSLGFCFGRTRLLLRFAFTCLLGGPGV